MKRAARTIAIVAMTVAVGCSGQLTPTAPPTPEVGSLRLYSTPATSQLVTLLLDGYRHANHDRQYELRTESHAALLQQLQLDGSRYFVSNHVAGSEWWAAPLAQDALVMIVHPDNPVTELDLTTLRRIYRGFITDWQAVGGSGERITIYSRETGSGTRLEFERLVMGQQQTTPNAQILPSSEAMLERIAADPHGIGYLPLSQLAGEAGVLGIEGVLPGITTIVDNTYPLRMTIYIIGAQDATGTLHDFLRWAQTSDGQAMLGLRYAPLPQ